MIAITNPKLSGFTPCWAAFPGFSLLFDNPGQCLVDQGDRLDLRVDAGDPALGLYQGLDAGLNSLDPDRLFREYGFALLPLASHHVTVWDGINQANVKEVDARGGDWRALLSDLPASLIQHRGLFECVECSPLVVGPWSLRFTLAGLRIWSLSALVAELRPADSASEQELHRLRFERSQLNRAFQDKVGNLDLREEYTPHVSLGYFANAQGATAAMAMLPDWSAQVLDRLAGVVLEFQRVRVYGFHDMVRFFTLPWRNLLVE